MWRWGASRVVPAMTLEDPITSRTPRKASQVPFLTAWRTSPVLWQTAVRESERPVTRAVSGPPGEKAGSAAYRTSSRSAAPDDAPGRVGELRAARHLDVHHPQLA